MKIELLNEENKELLEDFLNKNKDKRVQHSLKFRDVIKKTYKNCKDYYFLVIEKKKVVGYAPFILVKSRLFGNRLISIPFLDVGGFLGKVDDHCLEEIIRFAKNLENIKYLEVRLNESIKDFESYIGLLKRGNFVSFEDKKQSIVELSSEEEMWSKFHKHTRNDVRMSEKSGLELKEIDSSKEMRRFYALYSKQMKYFGTPPHSKNYFMNLLDKKEHIFKGFNCYKDNKIAGSIILLHYGIEGYVAFNVSEPKFRSCRPNDLLYWNAIKWCISKGIKNLDMGQINPDFDTDPRSKGLYKFKRKWMSELYTRKYYRYNFGKESSVSGKNKLKKLRNIWKLLPNFLTKIIGPKICSEMGI